MAASVMFSMAGVNKARFLEQVRADPQTYRDWAGNGEWNIETTGKEDDMFSPFLRKPFKRAVEEGAAADVRPRSHVAAALKGEARVRFGGRYRPRPRVLFASGAAMAAGILFLLVGHYRSERPRPVTPPAYSIDTADTGEGRLVSRNLF